MLVSYLDGQRRHIFGILDGLDEAALHKPVLPSAWTCVGLVHHLAVDVERYWFRGIAAGEQAVIDEAAAATEDGWHVPDVPAEEVFALYRRENELANAIIASTPLDAAPAWWPAEHFGDQWVADLREVILHVIVETACHAGHLDAARELIDGRRWFVID